MSSVPVPSPVPASAQPSRWRQYYALTKPRVVQLIVFCAVIGMFLAVPGWPPLVPTLAATAGIWLVAAAAAAFNCLVEQQIDRRMTRTAWRPTAKGELTTTQALLFSMVLCGAGAALLLTWVNAITLCLTLATFIGYAVIYTLILKPLTPQNIVIGGLVVIQLATGLSNVVLGWPLAAALAHTAGAAALVICIGFEVAAALNSRTRVFST